jgi:hypothetical protein
MIAAPTRGTAWDEREAQQKIARTANQSMVFIVVFFIPSSSWGAEITQAPLLRFHVPQP